MGLDGVEIFTNSSGSHHELRKLSRRIDLIKEATLKSGGIYLYANQQGCDGDRLYYDGCSFIALNGQIVAQGSQFSLNDVEVVVATVDIQEVRAWRSSSSRSLQAVRSAEYRRIGCDVRLGSSSDGELEATRAEEFKYHTPEEEIAYVPSHLSPGHRLTILTVDWGQPVGCGITCVAPRRKDTLSLSPEASIPARRPPSSTPCVYKSSKPSPRTVSLPSSPPFLTDETVTRRTSHRRRPSYRRRAYRLRLPSYRRSRVLWQDLPYLLHGN